MTPTVDINLFVHNGAATIAAAIDSVRAQTWSQWTLTLIDDGSSDDTPSILRAYAEADSRISIKRNRCNTGAVGAFQRGLWFGDADFVMPKSADDLIAPEFIERIMSVLLASPECAMVHAGALSFSGAGQVEFEYPSSHRLHAVSDDPAARAAHVMVHYTSAPSFWGIYRREAVDQLAVIAHRAGWDHVVLAELALYGVITHVPQILYWRRGTGRPVDRLARAATLEAVRGIALDTPLSDPMWRMPCITTAFAHVENFATARLPLARRQELIDTACRIFRARWPAAMRAEAERMRAYVAQIAFSTSGWDCATRAIAHLHLTRMVAAAAMLLRDVDFSECFAQVDALREEPSLCLA